jgi:hypothetical protein
MSANLIGLGADLQQKLDAMDSKLRKAPWAGDVGDALYQIAQRLHSLNVNASRGRSTRADDRAERELMDQAQREVNKLDKGIIALRSSDPRGWRIVIVFPGDVPKGSGPEAALEQGVAVPPRP